MGEISIHVFWNSKILNKTLPQISDLSKQHPMISIEDKEYLLVTKVGHSLRYIISKNSFYIWGTTFYVREDIYSMTAKIELNDLR